MATACYYDPMNLELKNSNDTIKPIKPSEIKKESRMELYSPGGSSVLNVKGRIRKIKTNFISI